MGCYNCTYLDINNKKEGETNGSLYYCTKMKKYINGAYDNCDNHSKDYERTTYDENEIYYNGRHFYNDNDTSLSIKIFLIVLLIIIAIIYNI